MSTQFKDVPEQYHEMFKAGISVINAGFYLEETLRNHVGKIKISPKQLKLIDGQFKTIQIDKYLLQQGEKALHHLKKYNECVSQLLVNKNGHDEINDMGYLLTKLFDDISYLSLSDQKKVCSFVKGLHDKYKNEE